MRLQMNQDDEAGFGRARDWLLDGFEGWLRAESGLDDAAAAEAVGDAGIALDWKFGYGDGNLPAREHRCRALPFAPGPPPGRGGRLA